MKTKRVLSEEAKQKISKAQKARWRVLRMKKTLEEKATEPKKKSRAEQVIHEGFAPADTKANRQAEYDIIASMAISHDEVPDLMNRIAHQLLVRALGGR